MVATATQKAITPVVPYNAQMDGMRFCAVAFVLCYHWLPAFHNIKIGFFFGGIINFFFVLSSYLITTILFNARDKYVAAGISKFRVLKIFVLRRTIRIFPAYYFFLFILMVLPFFSSEVRQHPAMYFGYYVNYGIFYEQAYPGATSHFWTLAVEEHFYLFWPFVILFIPHRYLLKTFLGIIITSIIARAIFFHQEPLIPVDILTQYCLDPLAIGGILAYKMTAPLKEQKAINKYSTIVTWVTIPIAIAVIAMQSFYFSFVINKFVFSIVSLKLIEGAIKGYKGYLGSFLNSKIAVFIGRISYPVYLYHLLVPIVFWKVYDHLMYKIQVDYNPFYLAHIKAFTAFENFLASQGVYFVLYFVITIACGVLSARFIEAPFLKLKAYLNFGTVPKKEHLAQRA